MPSNYQEIRQANIRRRGEDFDDIGRLIAEYLYPDRSHFIYELLQNAEDALAQRFRETPHISFDPIVQFNLFPDRLEFRHFGQLFNSANVEGIADILRGTKTNDPDQIGKFGIGFKSVYAITSSPEIHSGDEHFVIKRYIRPEAKKPRPGLAIAPTETVFVFPFDHHDLSQGQAYALVSDGLRTLTPQTLLFLSRIGGIYWTVRPGTETGRYLRETMPSPTFQRARRVTLIGQTSGGQEEQQWLVFKRPVTIAQSQEHAAVEVAFRLESVPNGLRHRITRVEPSPLAVYFQTEKHTDLGFLIHGPYHTTPARDNILQGDALNLTLIEETAELIIEALHQLKPMGLLTVSTLETLPIKVVRFSEDTIFHPLFARVKQALLFDQLLPASDGGAYVSARTAILARGAELMNLLKGPQLRVLFHCREQVHWVCGEITVDRTPDLHDYLIHELDITEVTPESFAREISKSFLEDQSDAWMVAFYRYLADQKSLWRRTRRHTYGSQGILRGPADSPSSGRVPRRAILRRGHTERLLAHRHE